MTRQHLLDAAAIVFARNGFHGSTLDEVAATAGFTKGAVYSNFKNKDDLFIDLLVDPDAVTEQTLDATLAFLYDAMGVADTSEAPGQSRPPTSTLETST